MNAFFYHLQVQWKIGIRSKGVLICYYIVPFVFFMFMGGVFTSIMPEAKKTLIQSMTVFSVTMGAMIGSPSGLVEIFGSDIKKAFQVGRIPLWSVVLVNFITAFLHLLIISAVLFIVAPLAFHAELPQPGTYFASLALFIFTSLCVATLLGLVVKSNSKLTMISQFVFLPSVMLSGIMFPAEMLPNALRYIGKILPATWGYELMCESVFAFDKAGPLLLITGLSAFAALWMLRRIKSRVS